MACGIWVVFALAVSITSSLKHEPNSVPNIYRDAALHWLASEVVYEGTGHGFLYPPPAAVCFAPLALLPPVLAGVLWRFTNISLMGYGLWRWSQRIDAGQANSWLFFYLTVSVLPLVASCAKLGQFTMTMTGLMLAGTAACAGKRWWTAAFQLTVATVVKPLALPLLLLCAAVYRRLWIPLVAAALAIAALPLITQSPGYVQHQWSQFAREMQIANDVAISSPWAQLFWTLRSAGIDVTPTTETVVRVLLAVLALLLIQVLARRLPTDRVIVYAFTIAALYILLLNPRTERNTYALIAPAICYFGIHALRQRVWIAASVNTVLYVLMLASNAIGEALFGDATVWMKPTVTLAFATTVLACMAREFHRSGNLPMPPNEPVANLQQYLDPPHWAGRRHAAEATPPAQR